MESHRLGVLLSQRKDVVLKLMKQKAIYRQWYMAVIYQNRGSNFSVHICLVVAGSWYCCNRIDIVRHQLRPLHGYYPR